MVQDIVVLVLSLPLILLSAELFTNGVESLGRRLTLSQAVVGSVLAAVGTALPETILPLVAILLHGGKVAKEIGIGAILGAPFMLSTLAFFLVGSAAFVRSQVKKRGFELAVETNSVKRDLLFFVGMYGGAIFMSLFAPGAHGVIAVALFAGYVVYVYRTFRGESADMFHPEELYIARVTALLRRSWGGKDTVSRGQGNRWVLVFLALAQVIFALVVMVGSAHVFVRSLETLSLLLGMNPVLFSLLIAPVATELPEKFNSISWTLKGRDTLAMGNITGAMVFQSTFPVGIGLLFTDWRISGLPLFSAILTLLSTTALLGVIHRRKKLPPGFLLAGGAWYVFYTAILFLTT